MAAIYLHAGHGGIDFGSIGKLSKEKDITLAISKYTEKKLTNAGFKVKLSRESDVTFSSPDAAEEANMWEANLVISVHCSFDENKKASGTETIIMSKGGEAEKFANILSQKAAKTLKTKNLGIKVNHESAILKLTKAPAVLLKTGYISNEAEEKILGSKTGQKAIADCIAESCCEFFDVTFPNEVEEKPNDNDIFDI